MKQANISWVFDRCSSFLHEIVCFHNHETCCPIDYQIERKSVKTNKNTIYSVLVETPYNINCYSSFNETEVLINGIDFLCESIFSIIELIESEDQRKFFKKRIEQLLEVIENGF